MECCNRFIAFTDKLDNITLMPIKKDIIHVYIIASQLLFNSLRADVKREKLNKTEINTLQLSFNYVEKVLTIDPDNCKGYQLYRSIKLFLTDYVETVHNQLDLLKNICKIDPYDHDIHYKIAYIYNVIGKFEETIEYYKLAIASIKMNKKSDKTNHINDETHIKYLLELAAIYREHDDYLQAEHYLSKALEINTMYPDIHNGYGLLYTKLNNIDRALFHFKYALKEQLKSRKALYYIAKIHAYIGNVYEKSGNTEMAKKEYDKASLYVPDLEDISKL
jgi:tetratricopeptide (TPR) repeat protein